MVGTDMESQQTDTLNYYPTMSVQNYEKVNVLYSIAKPKCANILYSSAVLSAHICTSSNTLYSLTDNCVQKCKCSNTLYSSAAKVNTLYIPVLMTVQKSERTNTLYSSAVKSVQKCEYSNVQNSLDVTMVQKCEYANVWNNTVLKSSSRDEIDVQIQFEHYMAPIESIAPIGCAESIESTEAVGGDESTEYIEPSDSCRKGGMKTRKVLKKIPTRGVRKNKKNEKIPKKMYAKRKNTPKTGQIWGQKNMKNEKMIKKRYEKNQKYPKNGQLLGQKKKKNKK